MPRYSPPFISVVDVSEVNFQQVHVASRTTDLQDGLSWVADSDAMTANHGRPSWRSLVRDAMCPAAQAT